MDNIIIFKINNKNLIMIIPDFSNEDNHVIVLGSNIGRSANEPKDLDTITLTDLKSCFGSGSRAEKKAIKALNEIKENIKNRSK